LAAEGAGMNFHFSSPGMLGLLLVLPVLFVLMRRGAVLRGAAMRHFGVSDHPKRLWKTVTSSAAVLCVVVALARPTIGSGESKHVANAGDVVFLLDVSRSMLSNDVRPSRLDRAKQLISELAGQLEAEDRVALVAFAGTQAMECPLTFDAPFFQDVLKNAGPESVARGGTRIGDAIRFAMDSVLDDVRRDRKQFVILTDGGDQQAQSESAAADTSERGIRLSVIGVGGSELTVVPTSMSDRTPVAYHGEPVRTKLESAALRKLAGAAHGQYWDSNEGQLLLGQIGQLQRTGEATELSLVFVAIALALLGIEAFGWTPGRQHAAVVSVITSLILNTPLSADESVAELTAKGTSAFQAWRYSEAIVPFEKAARLSHDKPEAVYNFAVALYAAGHFEEALQAFRKAAGSAPKRSILEAKCRMGIGDALYMESIKGVHSSNSDAPHLGAFWQSKSLAPDASEYMLLSALDEYKEALRIQPAVADAAYNIRVVERRLKAIQKASSQSKKEEHAKQDALSMIRASKTSGGIQQTAKQQPVDKDW